MWDIAYMETRTSIINHCSEGFSERGLVIHTWNIIFYNVKYTHSLGVTSDHTYCLLSTNSIGTEGGIS